MQKILPLTILSLGCAVLLPATASATTPSNSQPPSKFVFKDASGKATSVDVVEKYQPNKIVRPFAKIDRQLDPKLTRAATIAEERANAHSPAMLALRERGAARIGSDQVPADNCLRETSRPGIGQ